MVGGEGVSTAHWFLQHEHGGREMSSGVTVAVILAIIIGGLIFYFAIRGDIRG